MVVMVVGFLTVLVQGTKETGGLGVVWDRALNGSRLNVFNFDLDPLKRHTFWTISVGGMFTWLGIYGVNQSTIQRCISCKTWQALALYLNLLGLLVICGCAASSGIIMYAFYYNCDPWTAGYVRAPDQLMPFFVMEILGKLPGLPGLFVACAFSGTLSSVAASINALATVTYEDFVKNCFRNISDRAGTWMSKGLWAEHLLLPEHPWHVRRPYVGHFLPGDPVPLDQLKGEHFRDLCCKIPAQRRVVYQALCLVSSEKKNSLSYLGNVT
uniref:Solute carrier family 5 member 12 n=1 Tax=Scleropages formosus TaxID=113540 RepID=A0A8C9TFM1_SCLFO